MLFLNYHFLNIVFLNIAILKHWFFKYTFSGVGQNNQGPGPELPSAFTPYFDSNEWLSSDQCPIPKIYKSLLESIYGLCRVSIGTKKKATF